MRDNSSLRIEQRMTLSFLLLGVMKSNITANKFVHFFKYKLTYLKKDMIDLNYQRRLSDVIRIFWRIYFQRYQCCTLSLSVTSHVYKS